MAPALRCCSHLHHSAETRGPPLRGTTDAGAAVEVEEEEEVGDDEGAAESGLRGFFPVGVLGIEAACCIKIMQFYFEIQ